MGYRYSKEELERIDASVEEGVTSREIAERLGRSEAGIRNLRYRKGLVKKVKDDTKALLQRRDELQRSVEGLETKEQELQSSVQGLESKKVELNKFLY